METKRIVAKKAIIIFLSFSLLIGLVLFLLINYTPKIISPNYPYYAIFNWILYALTLYVLLYASAKMSAEKFMMTFLVITVAKMLMAMLFILIVIMQMNTEPVADAILFMSMYFLFLINELVIIFKA